MTAAVAPEKTTDLVEIVDDGRDIIKYRINAKDVEIKGSVFLSKMELDQEPEFAILSVVRPEMRPGKLTLRTAETKSFVIEVFPYHYTEAE